MSHPADPSRGGDRLSEFLDQLAARTPTPGGGSAAGLSAAMGAALLAMVAGYTTGSRFAGVEAEMRGCVEELGELRRRSLRSMEADEEAFAAVSAAYGLPRRDEAERRRRSAAIQAALVGAAGPPKEVAAVCARLAEIAVLLAERGNRNVLSDVGAGASCAAAALDGARLNVAVNAAQIRDPGERAALAGELAAMDRDRTVLQAVTERVRAVVSGEPEPG